LAQGHTVTSVFVGKLAAAVFKASSVIVCVDG